MRLSSLRCARVTQWAAFLALLALPAGSAGVVRAQEKSPAKPDAPAKAQDASSTGNLENGKKLFMSDGCFECHGTVGQGSTSTGGARIGPPAISLEEMTQYVRHPSGQMPPYTEKVLSDGNLADIYAYLKAQPKAQPGKNIPLLNQ